jgi:Tfp pilus assembly protein PilO
MSITPRILALVAAGLIAVVALGGWFVVVSPQQSKVASLDAKIVDEHAKLADARLVARSQKKTAKPVAIGAAALAKAMPTTVQMPSIVRQVQQLAASSRVTVESFTPSAATPAAGYEAMPIDVSVSGRYASVQGFLRRLRTQAGSNGTRVHANGRLFDVQTVQLTPVGTEGSDLNASITLAAFVYTGQPLPAADTTTTAPEATTGTESS